MHQTLYRVKQRKTSTISNEGGLEAREILSVRVQVVETLANICGGRLESEHPPGGKDDSSISGTSLCMALLYVPFCVHTKTQMYVFSSMRDRV